MTGPPDIQLLWDACSPGDWEAHLASCHRSCLEQSWAYGVAVESNSAWRVRRLLALGAARPLALTQVFERALPLRSGLAQIVRGPLWLGEPDPQTRLSVFRALRSRYRPGRRWLLLWMPEFLESGENEDFMRQLGLRRMVTGHSSAWLDLRPSEERLRRGLHGNWRNALAAAERGGLELRRGVTDGDIGWLLGQHDRFRRHAGFLGPSGRLIRPLIAAAPDCAEMLLAYRRARPLAGLLAITHGRSATYYLGYNSPEGRRARAQNLLLWQCLLSLKRRGIDWFDLGGFDGRTPGIARFKLGLGGEPYTLSGSYL